MVAVNPKGQPAEARPEGALALVRSAIRRTLLLLIVVSAGVNLLMLAPPLYMMQIYDRVIATGHLDTLLYLTAMAVAALALLALLDWARGVAAHRLAAWVDETLATEVVGATINAAHLSGAGRSVQGLRDLATIRGTIGGGALTPLFDLPWMPVFFAMVFLIHPVLGWLGIAGAMLLALLAVTNDLVSNGRVRRAGIGTISAIGEADAAVRNTDAIVAMGMLPGLLRRWRPLHDAASAPQTAAGEGSAAIAALAKFLRLGLQVAILGLGAWLVIRQEITGGTMIAASIMIGRAVAPLEQAIGTWRGVVSARIAYARLRRLLEEVPAPGAPMTLPAPTGALRAERATYTLPGEKEPILRQISFALRPGETLGLIGPSGAGKTTLARLLVGSLAPQSGWVRLDNAQLVNWGAADKLRHVGYLPQDIELFQASVRDNIARFADAGDEEVVAAAQLAGAHEMIMGLPQGYQTMLGPSGMMLSGGQRQRIGLARALFGQPRLVVLDEPNSNLDADGEQALVAALRRLKQAKATIVFIAQRMSLIGEADKLLMLRAGAVEAFGPREEVFTKVARPLAVASGGDGQRALRAVPTLRDAGSVS